MRLLAVTLALVLGGCLSGAQDAPAAEGLASGAVAIEALPETAAPAEAAGGAPLWNRGDAWAITAFDEASERQGFLVVVDASPDAYTLATTEGEEAMWDAIFDVSYLGRIRAADLAGSQKGEPVRFFDFPLADGKTWTARWDGMEIALAAAATGTGFAIAGTAPDGSPYVRYDYVPGLRWWSHLEFEEGYGFRVERRVENWTGAIVAGTAQTVLERETTLPLASPFVEPFVVDEGQTMVLLTLRGTASQYARAFQLFDPHGQPYLTRTSNTEISTAPSRLSVSEVLPPTPGQWTLVSPILHHPDGTFRVAAHQVALEERAFG